MKQKPPEILGKITDIVLNYRPTEAGRVPCADPDCRHPKWRHRNGRGACDKTTSTYGADCYCKRFRKT